MSRRQRRRPPRRPAAVREQDPALGTEVELEPTAMAHGGVAVARLDGRVVFVPDTLPGERIRARISDAARSSFWRAELLEVLEPSPHRVPHVWAEAGPDRAPESRPGGADYGHASIEYQRRLKAEVLADALRRMAGLEPPIEVEAAPGEPDGSGWRTRIRLHIGPDGLPGPMAARSNRVVRVAALPLATPEVRAAAPLTERFSGVDRVDVLSVAGAEARLIVGQQAPTTIVETVRGRGFRLDDGGFWQVHPAAATLLTAAVQDAVDPERFDPRAANLDLYGGVGLLAAALGDRFGPSVRVTSVESDARATEHAQENLADWVGASAVTARVEAWVRGLAEPSALERPRLEAATVVLDPPRTGAGAAVIESLAAARVAQLVYVACDPVALARDAALLGQRGYALRSLRALDLFPNTHHLEAIAAFDRV